MAGQEVLEQGEAEARHHFALHCVAAKVCEQRVSVEGELLLLGVVDEIEADELREADHFSLFYSDEDSGFAYVWLAKK